MGKKILLKKEGDEPYIHFYIKDSQLSSSQLVKILNSTEALIYLGLINFVTKTKMRILYGDDLNEENFYKPF